MGRGGVRGFKNLGASTLRGLKTLENSAPIRGMKNSVGIKGNVIPDPKNLSGRAKTAIGAAALLTPGGLGPAAQQGLFQGVKGLKRKLGS